MYNIRFIYVFCQTISLQGRIKSLYICVCKLSIGINKSYHNLVVSYDFQFKLVGLNKRDAHFYYKPPFLHRLSLPLSPTMMTFATTSFFRRFFKELLRISFCLLIFLAFVSTVFHFFYVFSTSKLYNDHTEGQTRLQFSKIDPQAIVKASLLQHEITNQSLIFQEPVKIQQEKVVLQDTTSNIVFQEVSISPSLSSIGKKFLFSLSLTHTHTVQQPGSWIDHS